MNQTTQPQAHLQLKTIRLDCSALRAVHFSSDISNSAGMQISFDEDTGTLWWSSDLGGNDKHLVHARNKPAIEWADGTQAWVQKGLYHRTDGPALMYNGAEDKEDKYYLNGVELTRTEHYIARAGNIEPVVDDEKLTWVMEGTSIPHRGDLNDAPAVVWNNGDKEWYIRGVLNRANGPARIKSDGGFGYYSAGKLHRKDGPACKDSDGSEGWFIDGRLHRKSGDGPALTHADGGTEYWQNGHRHNMIGPAVVFPDGDVEYWLNNHKMSYDAWNRRVSMLVRETLGFKISNSLKDGDWLNENIRKVSPSELTAIINNVVDVIMENREPAPTGQLELPLSATPPIPSPADEIVELKQDVADDGEAPINKVTESPMDDAEALVSWKATLGALIVAAGAGMVSSMSGNHMSKSVTAVQVEREIVCQ